MANQRLNDRYEILQQLGKRTGRETLLARDSSTQNLAVIKILKFSSEFEWDDLKLFEREAQILQHLNHPAIPQYLDFFEFEVPQYKGFALVQTYIETKSLEQHRQAGRTFTEEEVKQIAEQLLKILSYLHDRHPPVIHRDLKPSNILLGDRSAHTVGKVYLVDFGSVQNVAATEGGTFTVVGTYGYMPPEQFGGRTVPASDLYSLGATLMYLLTGKHPADLPQKNLQIDVAKVAKLSLGFEQWLEKMLEPSLDRRLISAQTGLQALRQPDLLTLSEFFKKPDNSKIILKKEMEDLKIRLPYKQFSYQIGVINFRIFNNPVFKFLSPAFFLAFIYLVLNIGVFMHKIMMWGNGIGGFLLFIPMLTVMLMYAFLKVEIKVFAKKEKVKNNKFAQYGIFKGDILKIERTKLYIVRFKGQDGETHEKTINPSIVMWVGTTQYIITDLTEPEADWLGAELSDFLDLPLEYRDIPVIDK